MSLAGNSFAFSSLGCKLFLHTRQRQMTLWLCGKMEPLTLLAFASGGTNVYYPIITWSQRQARCHETSNFWLFPLFVVHVVAPYAKTLPVKARLNKQTWMWSQYTGLSCCKSYGNVLVSECSNLNIACQPVTPHATTYIHIIFSYDCLPQ